MIYLCSKREEAHLQLFFLYWEKFRAWCTDHFLILIFLRSFVSMKRLSKLHPFGKHIKTTTTTTKHKPRQQTQDDLHNPHPTSPPPLPPPIINAPPPESRRTSPVRSQTAIKPPLSKLNNPTEPSPSSPQPSASPPHQSYTTAFQQQQVHLPSAKQPQSHHLTLPHHHHQETSAPRPPQPRRAIRTT